MSTIPAGEAFSRFSRPGRLLRFSLSTLLVLTSFLCLWLGQIAYKARQQARAVAAIEAIGGEIGYDYEYDVAQRRWLHDSEARGPRWLRKRIGPHYFDHVVSVSVWASHYRNKMGQRGRRFADLGPHLAKLPRLKRLHLGGRNLIMDTRDWAIVRRLNALEDFWCDTIAISDEGAMEIAQVSSLRRLLLNDVEISAKGVAEFKKLSRLETFSLVCRHLDYGTFNEPIAVDRYKLGDEVVASFLEFPKLHELHLGFSLVSDAGVEVLSRLDRLQALSINSPNVTNAAMESIVQLKNLCSLDLGGTKIDDAALLELQHLPKLTDLRLSAAVTNRGLPKLAALGKLESLGLAGKGIDDSGLLQLAGMKNLKHLDVRMTEVTTDGAAVKQLRQLLPNCRIQQYHPSPSFR